MGSVVDMTVATALSNEKGESQTTDTRTDVNDISASKVKRASLIEQTMLSPDHMSKWIVDDEGPENNKEKNSLEVHSTCNCTR